VSPRKEGKDRERTCNPKGSANTYVGAKNGPGPAIPKDHKRVATKNELSRERKKGGIYGI
jgi:hypothetical protein